MTTYTPESSVPILLPHLLVRANRVEFLGEPVDEDPAAAAAVVRRCRDRLPLGAYPEPERATLTRWRDRGYAVIAGPAKARPEPGSIALSPHPDDTALAVGALLAQEPHRVINVFSHETWTRRPYYRDRPELTSRLLLAEDEVACACLGCPVRHLGLTDAAARPAWAGGFIAGADGRPQEREPALAADVLDRVAAVVADRRVLAPLAVGGHVDHLLVRDAVLELVGGGRLAPASVRFYADMPYSLFGDPEPARELVDRRLRSSGLELREMRIPLAGTALDAQAEALCAYRLQVSLGVIRRLVKRASRDEHVTVQQVVACDN